MQDEYFEYYTYDKPIPINDLFLYPVKMDKYVSFYKYIGCLLFNKNRIPDSNVISMSYLAFLYYISMQSNEFLEMLQNLLYMCFRLDNTQYMIDFNVDEKNKPCIYIYEKNTKTKFKFSYKDFNKIRKIICEQNLIDLPNEKIDPKLEAALLETQNFVNKKNNNIKIISLEDQIISVLINTNLNLDSIFSLSIRKFVKILQRKNKELHYQIYTTASLSGMVEFKQPITHYLYDDNKDKYADLVTDYDSYMGKFSNVGNIQKGGK
jgi:hypothetical protein